MATISAEQIQVGDRFAGITGNVMVVRAIQGDEVYLSYQDDPDDGSWDKATDVVRYFEYRGRP